MIVYNPRIKYEKRRPILNSNSSIEKNVTKKHSTSIVHENTVACVNTTDKTNFAKAFNSVSPYWFFVIGFLLGIACGMFIGLASAAGYALQAPPGVLPVHAVGYVYLPAAIGVAVTSILSAPLGTRLAHAISGPMLKKVFAVFMFVVGGGLLLS